MERFPIGKCFTLLQQRGGITAPSNHDAEAAGTDDVGQSAEDHERQKKLQKQASISASAAMSVGEKAILRKTIAYMRSFILEQIVDPAVDNFYKQKILTPDELSEKRKRLSEKQQREGLQLLAKKEGDAGEDLWVAEIISALVDANIYAIAQECGDFRNEVGHLASHAVVSGAMKAVAGGAAMPVHAPVQNVSGRGAVIFGFDLVQVFSCRP